MRGALAVLLAVLGCGGSDDDNDDGFIVTDGGTPDAAAEPFYQPGEPITLTRDNRAADEDPSVLAAEDRDTWTAPRAVTDDDGSSVLDVFPSLYADHAGNWSHVWFTTALAETGNVVALPVDGSYPADRVVLPMTGYSPRVAPTPTEGVFLGAWVEGPTGQQDVRVRLFSAP